MYLFYSLFLIRRKKCSLFYFSKNHLECGRRQISDPSRLPTAEAQVADRIQAVSPQTSGRMSKSR